MKGQISRDSHRPAKRYSGVYHVQGGMITDADLDERSDIVKHRTDALGRDAVRDGCPAIGGAVDVSGATPVLREGDIYADGVRGELRVNGAAATLAQVIANQVDFPDGPALTGGARLIYADIWERPVFPLEDPYLADPGLHGAETAWRSRTMCQIKHAPQDHAAAIEAGTGRYPQIGNATLAVAERDPATTVDECDPCADVVSADLSVSNTLWRLEVVRVRGRADAPTQVELAWSAENASAIAPASVSSEAFERAGAVYERYSTTTESHMGALSDPNAIQTSTFVDDLDSGGPGGMPFVRRWDGYARLDMGAGTVIETLGAGFTLSFNGTDAVLTVDEFEATLSLGGRSVLRGDYWLVELRTFAPPTERIRLVSPTPVGVLHHYCVLFRASGGAGEALTDAENRKLSFPALSDLPATHVGFDNNCPKLYNAAENVQEALDELCSISAEDIDFDNNCPRLYDGATNVQQALDNLCKVDFNIETVLRLLMDWGVVCGLTARLTKANSSLVTVAPGWFLDRAGRLAQFEGGEIDIRKLLEQLPADERKEMGALLLKGEACLTVALDENRKARLHLVPKARAFGPADPGLVETVRACIEGTKRIDPRKDLTALSENDRKVVAKMALIATEPNAFGGSQRMSKTEERAAIRYTDSLAREFAKNADDADKAMLTQQLDTLDRDFAAETAVGAQLEIRRAIYAANRLAAILESDQERARRCLCLGIFPACPPDLGKPPFHVPIACLKAAREGEVVLEKVCMFSCRKQAMTWRSVNYVIKDWRERLAVNLARYCCADEKTDVTGNVMTHKTFTYDAALGKGDMAGFVQSHAILDDVIGEGVKLSKAFVAKPDIADLTLEAARDVISGHGADVVTTVEISDAKAADLIAAHTSDDPLAVLGEKPDFAPGDKVAILTQGGKARGYVVVERGAGKFLFTPESERKATRPAAPGGLTDDRIGRLTVLADRLKTVTDSETRIDSEITELAKLRDGLLADVDRLKQETEALDKNRDRARREIASAGTELRKLAEAQQETIAVMSKARDELREAEAQKDVFVRNIRENHPVGAIVADEETRRVLAANNVFTVADARKRSGQLGLDRRRQTALVKTLDRFVETGGR